MKALQQLCGGVNPRALLFDLDGTLVDSVPDLAVAVDFALTRQQLPPAGEHKVRRWVGNGALRLVQRALADALDTPVEEVPEARVENTLQHFFGAYAVDCSRHTRVYPGVMEALEYWRSLGIGMACVTNKPMRFTETILAHYKLDSYFDACVAGDSLEVRKPDPRPLYHACDLLGVDPAGVIMVGDSRNDIRAARAANMPVVAVSYGYNHGAPIAEENPDILVDALSDLI